jgi:transposase InsO family protein
MVHSNENDTEGTMPKKKMGIDSRYEYLDMQYERYHQVDLHGKSALLTEMTEVTGLRRKSLIRLMSSPPERHKRSKQRSRTYCAETEYVIRVIDRALDHPCRERLKPMLTYMADHLCSLGQLNFSLKTRQQLQDISVSSVGRLLGRIRQDEYRLRRRATSTSISPIQALVPIHNIAWDEREPGHFEVDLVFHSGASATGEFVYTLQMVDVATGWSELVAILGRSYRVMQDAFFRCLDRIPFPVLEVHSDNGSEFLNGHLLAFWKQKYTGIFLSRTRPYHSQDNRFVEHRNGALVRALLGHDRLDTAQQVQQLNRAYDLVWSYFNYFQPVMRQTEKTYENGHTRRKHEDVRTPWQRVTDGRFVFSARQHGLQARFEATNPFVLRDELDQALVTLFRMPNAVSGQTEDIFKTLIYTPSI